MNAAAVFFSKQIVHTLRTSHHSSFHIYKSYISMREYLNVSRTTYTYRSYTDAPRDTRPSWRLRGRPLGFAESGMKDPRVTCKLKDAKGAGQMRQDTLWWKETTVLRDIWKLCLYTILYTAVGFYTLTATYKVQFTTNEIQVMAFCSWATIVL